MGPARRVFPLLPLILVLAMMPGTLRAAESLEFTVGFDPESIAIENTDSGTRYSLDGAYPLHATGAPELPYLTWKIVLPQGQGIAEVEVRDAAWAGLDVPKTLRMVDALYTSEGEPVQDSMEGLSAQWGKSEFYPAAPARSQGVALMEGYHIGGVELMPLRVNAQGAVEVLVKGTLVVRLEAASFEDPAQRAVAWPGVADAAAQRVSRLVINPAAVAASAPSPGTPYQLLDSSTNKLPHPQPLDEVFKGGKVDYVIVTVPSLVSEFQRLADDHIAHGLATKVVTTDWITANYPAGVDLAETIRIFLKQCYSDWGLRYALLGGDSEVVPTRYVRSYWYPTNGYSDVPCDLYFGGLDGNWNANGNGIFGEAYKSFIDTGDDQDMVAEVVVGRAPVNNLMETTTFVDKCLVYQNPTEVEYLGRALFLSEVLFPSNWDGVETINLDGASYSEDIVFNKIITPGNLIESYRFYENYTAYPYAEPETKQAALDSMSSGRFGLVNHVGHGFYYNMSVGDDNIYVSDVLTLTNAPNSFMLYALNCSSAAFDFDCLLETFVQHPGGGSVASIGSCRAAFPTTADKYQQEFYRQIFVVGNTRIGEAMNASRDAYTPNSLNAEGFERWTHFTYTLLGDPALRMWRRAPVTPTVTLPASVPLGTDQITVTVEEGGLPVPAAQVTLHKQGEAYATAQTDSLTGQVVLDLRPLSQGDIDVVVAGSSLKPWFDTISVGPAAAAHIAATPLLVDDGPGGDNLADAGETLGWYFRFENNGDGTTAPGVEAVLRLLDAPGATLLDSTVTVGEVVGGGTVDPPEAFGLLLDDTIADGSTLTFELESTSGGDSWTQEIELRVLAPEPRVTRVVVDDSSTGNGDGIIQPGETIELFVEVKNFGQGILTGLTGTLTGSANVTVVQPSNSWSDMALMDSGYGLGAFQVIESDVAVENYMLLDLFDAKGHHWKHWIELRDPVPPPAAVPNTTYGPTTIVLEWEPPAEPHLYGYRVYRSDVQGGPYEEITVDALAGSGFYRDNGLGALTRYYYRVATVDSSMIESALGPEIDASTAPPQISSAYPLPSGGTVQGALAVGDIRGDGSLMVVVASTKVYALDWQGQELLDGDVDAQTLGPISGEGTDFTLSGVTLADLDGDPYPEIIVNHWAAPYATYAFDNDGSVLPGWPQNTGQKSWGCASAGDLDGDGDMEIVVNNTGGKTYAWHHDGTEVFDGDSNPGTNGVFHVRPGEQFTRVGIGLYDLDGDGGRDIIFGTNYRNGSPNYMHAFKANGTEVPGWPQQTDSLGFFVSGVTIADLDQDGIVEIISPCDNDSLYIWQPDGSRKPGFPIFFKSNSGSINHKTPAIAVGELDGDPELEMVGVSVLSANTADMHVLDPDGSLLPGWPIPLAAHSRSSPIIGDLDGDGAPDIVFGAGKEDGIGTLHGFHVDGSSLPGFPISIGAAPWGTPMITDFDYDGDADLLVAGQDNLIHVYDMPGQYLPSATPWATYQGNVQRTGVYMEPHATAVEPVNPTPTRKELVLLPNVPNPFNPSTTIRFEIPAGAGELPVSLEIYDLAGRRVRGLLARQLPAGKHDARWDGKDDGGSAVSSGVYFARLQVGAQVQSVKMTLAK